ncbi:MAG: hypothetical protein DHS20C03_15340 [Minwuia thermotolerans]|nr:MAG: hypothetical protein DHS20C03_15340 [Minwuia thermotolerans]
MPAMVRKIATNPGRVTGPRRIPKVQTIRFLWAKQFGREFACSTDFGPDFFQDAPSKLGG